MDKYLWWEWQNFFTGATGNIHRAKENYLKLTTNSLDKIREMASNYWKQELKMAKKMRFYLKVL